jgi:FAD/FMN-containing dehydrogenase
MANERIGMNRIRRMFFWGEKYDRLLGIKKRVDPTGVFVCNRCVGGDILLEP